jgi:hypothetical protein
MLQVLDYVDCHIFQTVDYKLKAVLVLQVLDYVDCLKLHV